MTSPVLAALFEDHPKLTEALRRLSEAGFSEEDLSILASDRTAERDLSVSRRAESELQSPLEGILLRLASKLRPIAPLGAPGAGTVAAGPSVVLLERAGLGTVSGLEQALKRCGAPPDVASRIFQRVRSGAVLVLGRTPHAEARHAFETALNGAALTVELRGNDQPINATGIVVPPQASPGEQRAAFLPAIRGLGRDDILRNRTQR
ncbi:MAG: hypothetical protein DIU78_002515 [Pseudomonadota bacterium]